MPLYFAYGSNLFSPRMLRRIPEAAVVGVGRLDDHRLVFDKIGRDGSAKANIEAATGSVVFGVVYEIPEDRLPELDRVEGGYRRVRERVVMRDHDHADCETYRSALKDPALLPHDWYVELVLDGARQHALPAEYVELIERVAGRR